MLGEFEASFMRILIDKFDVSPEQVGRLLAEECAHGGDLVTRAPSTYKDIETSKCGSPSGPSSGSST